MYKATTKTNAKIKPLKIPKTNVAATLGQLLVSTRPSAVQTHAGQARCSPQSRDG